MKLINFLVVSTSIFTFVALGAIAFVCVVIMTSCVPQEGVFEFSNKNGTIKYSPLTQEVQIGFSSAK